MIRFSIVGVVAADDDPRRVAVAVQTATTALKARLGAVARFDCASLSPAEEVSAVALVFGPDSALPALRYALDTGLEEVKD